MKKLLLIVLLLPFLANSQALNEQFNYGATAGSLTTISSNWTAVSSAGTNPIQYITSGLSMTGYQGANGAVTFTTSGEDDARDLTTPINTGSVYASALISISSAQAAGDYFFNLKNTSTTFAARVFVKLASAGVINFGFGKAAASPTYGTTNFALNTTYLIVVKYTFNTANGTDDLNTLWVLPAGSSFVTEGAAGTPLVAAMGSGAADLAQVAGVLIRQGTAASAPAGTIDEIRVGTTWEDAVNTTVWNGTAWSLGVPSTTTNARASANLSLSSNFTAREFEVDAAKVITPGSNTLTISKVMTLKSDATGTAIIGQGSTSNYITGDVTAERYISNKRAWRLLGVPFSTSTQTIKASWMEGAADVSSNPVPGYGTQITTYTGDVNAANFDATKPASSIRIYAGNNFTSDGTHTPNITALITDNPAYFLFVRGDRAIDRTSSGAATTSTTLRITGTPSMGSVTKGVTGTSSSLIPNPYPSAIDFDVVKASNSSIGIFYVWDATLAGPSGVGQYRTVQISGSGPNYTYTATPGSADNKWRYIESGTAFFIQGSGTVNFTEAMKTAGIPPSSMLRVTSPNQTELAVNLNIVNADNTTSLADGVREVFDNSYSTAIDNNDAKKIAGFELNLGISSNSEILAIEKRPLPNTHDVISLNLGNMSQGNYQFELQPANLPTTLTPYLKDNYLGTYTPIDLTADTKINFSITADAASSATSRFNIVFTKAAVSPARSLITIYPNPVQNGVVTLLMNNMPKGTYQVRLLNAVGQTILTKQINHAEGSSTETFNVNKVKGAYTIEVTKPDNSKINSKIIIN